MEFIKGILSDPNLPTAIFATLMLLGIFYPFWKMAHPESMQETLDKIDKRNREYERRKGTWTT